MRASQPSLFSKTDKRRYSRRSHGHTLNKGKRKLERPLSTKQWMHLTLKSDKAKGQMSFLTSRNKEIIRSVLAQKAKKFGVIIADRANVGNHLHLKIKIQSRKSFQNFLRAVTTLIARKITGARRGKRFGKFWAGLAFTRVLMSFKEEVILGGYFRANRIESKKGYQAREKFRREFSDYVYGRGRFVASG